MWVRGLKPDFKNERNKGGASHPMWVRGLKRELNDNESQYQPVAPHVGAWIETATAYIRNLLTASHPMWVRGLKQVLRRSLLPSD